jgi:pimeloyl-ACP methyl ester carboxylesterase
MPYLTVAGARAYYVEMRPTSGTSPPVALIHGAGGSHQHWLHQVRGLPSSRAIALDLPGHGRSEGDGRDSIVAYGDWLVTFLDAAGLEEAVLVGHSMGGAIALDVALRYPPRVAGLGLVATGARLRVAPVILEGFRQQPDATVDLISRWAFGPDVPEATLRMGRSQMAQTPAEVFYNDFAACDAFDAMDHLAKIEAPALVMCGTADKMAPVKYATFLRNQIAGASLHLVEGAGHMVMVERPEEVTAALSGFVEGLPHIE